MIKWTEIFKILLGVALSAIIGLLSYIAVTLKEIPVRISENEKWHLDEQRLREGRDESLQRQINKLRDDIYKPAIEIVK